MRRRPGAARGSCTAPDMRHGAPEHYLKCLEGLEICEKKDVKDFHTHSAMLPLCRQ